MRYWCISLRGSYATWMWLVPKWVTSSLQVTFGGRGGIMTTAGLELPCPCYIPQVYLCVSLRDETCRRGGGNNVTERGKIYNHFKPAMLAFTAMRFHASLSVEVKQRVCGKCLDGWPYHIIFSFFEINHSNYQFQATTISILKVKTISISLRNFEWALQVNP